MYPYIHIVLPSYGTFAVLGAIVVMIFLFFRIDKCNIPFSDFLKMFGLSIVYGSVGSRVLYIVSRIPWLITYFSLKIVISTVFGGGFVFYGGLLGVLLVVYRYSTKSSLMIFDRHANLKYKYGNRHFWARGYFVDTVGRNKKQIEEYIKNQFQEDQIADQMSIKEYVDPFTGRENK